MIHRVAQQKAGETALVTGANGGVGQALLELLALAGFADLAEVLQLLAEGKIHPVIAARLPLLDARAANELLEAGGVNGKIVLVRQS